MPFRYGVMNDEEKRKRKKEMDIYEVRFPTQTKVIGTLQVVLHLDSECF